MAKKKVNKEIKIGKEMNFDKLKSHLKKEDNLPTS